MARKIDEIDLSKLKLKRWTDPQIPEWYSDPAVWRYLGQKYGLQPGGIIDDEEDKPPIIIIARAT